MKLTWTEPAEGNDDCPYTHCSATTPFGEFLLTWKSWKSPGSQGLGFDVTPWNAAWYEYDWYSVEQAQAAAQIEFDRRVKLCPSGD